MSYPNLFNGGPVIVIKTICSETLASFPDLYITSLEEAIRANADNFEALETIRKRLIGLRAEVDNLQAQMWARENNLPKGSKVCDWLE